jgi:hypothetical protein
MSLDINNTLKDFALSFDDTKVFLANYKNGMAIVDISTPANPMPLGTYK